MSEFSKKIYDCRISKGYTQSKLARMVNIDSTWITRIEKGEKIPSEKVVEALARAIDYPVHDLKVLWTMAKIPQDALQDVAEKVYRERPLQTDQSIIRDPGAEYYTSEIDALYHQLPESERKALLDIAKALVGKSKK